MENNFSLSDIAALIGNSGTNGGNLILLLVILMAFSGGFGWNRNGGDYGQYATAASQQEILFGQRFQDLDNKADRLGNGIADATFALNNSIKDSAASVAGAVVTEGRGIQKQLSDYQLESQKNVDALRYDMAQQFAVSNANTSALIQSVKDMIANDKVAAMQARINSLELAQQMCNVVRYPNGWTYNAGPSPFCPCNNGGNCC